MASRKTVSTLERLVSRGSDPDSRGRGGARLSGGGGRGGRPIYDPSARERSGSRSYLGVPDDYVAERPDTPARGFTGDTRGVRPSIPYRPRYREGDEWLPANTSPAAIWDLQKALMQAGLITRGTRFQKGIWDETTREAYRALLEMANASGYTDEQMLNQLIITGGLGNRGYFDPETGEWVTDMGEGGGSGMDRAPLVAKVHSKEDLRQFFRRAIIAELGEGWSQDRIEAMVNHYQQLEIREQKREYDLGTESGGTVEMAPSPEAFAQSQAQSVDPVGYQANQAMGYINEIFDLINNPGWGSSG